MKIKQVLSLTIITFLINTLINGQGFVCGQLNNTFIYSIVDSNTSERLFTGISVEIGAEGPQASFLLKNGFYSPRNYVFQSVVEDQWGYYNEIEIAQRIMIYELGLYGRYYFFTDQGDPFRIFSNSGIEMVWAFAKNEYTLYDELFVEKFNNKQLKVALGFGFEVEVLEDIYLVNDFLFKYPLSSMDENGTLAIDVPYDFAFNFNIGVKIYL